MPRMETAGTPVFLKKVFKRDQIEVKSEGYLNNLELRFPNEAARHKLLDVVGDLTLVGYPIKARIIANRPGHSSNVEFAKKFSKDFKLILTYINQIYNIDIVQGLVGHGTVYDHIGIAEFNYKFNPE